MRFLIDAQLPPSLARFLAGGLGKASYGPWRQEPATQELLIRSIMVEEVPLAGLSIRTCATVGRRRAP